MARKLALTQFKHGAGGQSATSMHNRLFKILFIESIKIMQKLNVYCYEHCTVSDTTKTDNMRLYFEIGTMNDMHGDSL